MARPSASFVLVAKSEPEALQRAVQSYLQQDIADRELIVVDDTNPGWQGSLPEESGIRYLRLPPGMSDREKLEYGLEQARAAAIAAWNGAQWLAVEAGAPEPPLPLVSCIMPTANRRRFVPQAIRFFLNQEYPRRELIVVDDGQDSVRDLVPLDPRIRYFRLEPGHSVGAKRNFACEQSRGDLIANWDDDDWMAPWRLHYQVQELLKHEADICGLARLYFWGNERERLWEYIYTEGPAPWVAGGTMLYRRAYWQRSPYPDVSVGEDNLFVWSDTPKKVLALEDKRFYVATIHPGNTSPKLIEDERWKPADASEIRAFMGDEFEAHARLAFDAEFAYAEALPRVARARQGAGPLVSCILATANRPEFLRQAIRYFLRQTYTNAELVVVDHSAASAALCAGIPSVRLVQAPESASLGARLNLGAEAARGGILQKIDDDDFYHPTFLECAVSAMQGCDPARNVVGWDCFYVLFAGQTGLRHSGHGWCAGGTLCFHRALWEKAPFRDLPREVDRWFLNDTQAEPRRVCAPELYVLLRHGRNTWNRMQDGDAVDDYLWSLPANGPSILNLVEPIDHAFYLELQGHHAAAV